MIPISTIEDLCIELRRAVCILRAMPHVGPARRLRSSWPIYPQNTGNPTIYGYRPTPEEIDDIDLVLEIWLKVLTPEDKKLVFLRSSGYRWKALCRIFNASRNTLNIRYHASLLTILRFVTKLQNEKKNGEKHV